MLEFDPFIENHGIVILDGAMATELEKRGADLNDSLWSARLLIENPALIKDVHLDYLEAGADIITTASYQASFTGFEKQGYSAEKAKKLMILSTKLAIEAREEYVKRRKLKTPSALIAASVGPYGASLADGSEYTGNYRLSVEELMNFHRERLGVLAESGADLLACETIPCPEEAIAIIRLLKELPKVKAWISFSCRNEKELCNGSLFSESASVGYASNQIVAVGLNCTAPQYVESLVRIAVQVSNKPVIVYPNKGERYDAQYKSWLPRDSETEFIKEAVRWRDAGATIIGGCCRSTPTDISKLKLAMAK